MRPVERIPIFLQHVDLHKLLVDIWNLPLSLEEIPIVVSNIKSEMDSIRKVWIKNRDLRFSQVLIKLGLIHNYVGFWFYMEEHEILKEMGVQPRDYLLWGSRFDKRGKLLKKVKWVSIRDLSTDHILKILKEKHTNRIDYLSAFETELILRKVDFDENYNIKE